jgi:hypothetical protein
MSLQCGGPLEKPRGSRILAEVRSGNRAVVDRLDPGRRMEIVFALSVDALKFQIAGLKAQGFSETEIENLNRARHP